MFIVIKYPQPKFMVEIVRIYAIDWSGSKTVNKQFTITLNNNAIWQLQFILLRLFYRIPSYLNWILVFLSRQNKNENLKSFIKVRIRDNNEDYPARLKAKLCRVEFYVNQKMSAQIQVQRKQQQFIDLQKIARFFIYQHKEKSNQKRSKD